MKRRLAALASLLMLATAALALAHAAYIPAKAALAQWLLVHAWEQRGTVDGVARPWPGADMRPLARLSQSRLGIDQVVLDGASGRLLAFGPGHVVGSGVPGSRGNVVISGHRDTHFAWLAQLRVGDDLALETRAGEVLRYRVTQMQVVHERDSAWLDPAADDGLRLVTCYPFVGVAPGTPWRYLVSATRLSP